MEDKYNVKNGTRHTRHACASMGGILLIIFTLFISCTTNKHHKDIQEISVTDTLKDPAIATPKNFNSEDTIVNRNYDFINGCKNLNVMYGKLQGNISPDSLEFYPMGECYEGKRSYELLWVVYSRSC